MRFNCINIKIKNSVLLKSSHISYGLRENWHGHMKLNMGWIKYIPNSQAEFIVTLYMIIR